MYSSQQQTAPPDGSQLGELLREYRDLHGLTQIQLAALVGVDQSYVSMIERNKRQVRDVGELRRFAEALGLPEDELGLAPLGFAARLTEAPATPATGPAKPQEALGEQQRWRHVRRALNSHRLELSRAAAAFYADIPRAGQSLVLAKPEWMAPTPVDLSDVSLTWINQDTPPLVTGVEPESRAVRPMSAQGRPFGRYSQAIRIVDPPRLFDNRLSYRLLEVDWSGGVADLAFGYTMYFDMFDVCEGLAHETAQGWIDAASDPNWLDAPAAALPFRKLIGDPFDLSRRPLLPSIDTLTIRLGRAGEDPSFVLHHRSSASVAIAGDTYHVMPAGVFQPSSPFPAHQSNDFNLWRNMMREYAEEFLGLPEADGNSSEPIDYQHTEPYRALSRARRSGQARAWCFGIGLDPLTLAGEILTTVVFDPDVFDELFVDMVNQNMEGTVVSTSPDRFSSGIPFTEDNVRRLLDHEPLAPAAAACLSLAWEHRGTVLG
ncbi:helix-turn-helix domain-containing protein [Mangrovactinospora gilvigrisea]|uniref:helix-turn-helix domain-containing protein n=1 Tax=Mangrovactinospora gilvigrisea TaxID=1428644 RepID=UPI001C312A3A|nr:helix-turn-helix transcriptional regulator [Mangrovactinospora gilvigrisea]